MRLHGGKSHEAGTGATSATRVGMLRLRGLSGRARSEPRAPRGLGLRTSAANRGLKAMQQLHATACSGLRVRASSDSPSLSAMQVEPAFDRHLSKSEQRQHVGDDLAQY
jgi:hypothetical protein